MKYLTTEDNYRSPSVQPSWIARRVPSLVFYLKMAGVLYAASRAAKRGELTSQRRINSSLQTLINLESVGVRFEIDNLGAFRNLKLPCVFVSNHMSTLETFVFPAIIEPYRGLTFVIKESLLRYPVFKHIMATVVPVVVTREKPRQDFRVILEEGRERLSRDISVVIFPQTTRSVTFDPAAFNTVGVKLASHAEVPVIPVALKTDAWGNSRHFIRDLGPIDPSKTVHICFGEPIKIQGNGKAEHQQIIAFIEDKLRQWGQLA